MQFNSWCNDSSQDLYWENMHFKSLPGYRVSWDFSWFSESLKGNSTSISPNPLNVRSVSTSSIIPPFDAVGIWQHRKRKVREGHGVRDKIILTNCRECDLETQYLLIRKHCISWVSLQQDVSQIFIFIVRGFLRAVEIKLSEKEGSHVPLRTVHTDEAVKLGQTNLDAKEYGDT